MRLFIVGATGKTGVELVDLATERGHAVTAYVRSAHKLARAGEKLSVVKGDVRDAGALAAFMLDAAESGLYRCATVGLCR